MNRWTTFLLFSLFFFPVQGQDRPMDWVSNIDSIQEGYVFGASAWLITIEGDTIPLLDLIDTYTILDYWSAGCKPCLEAFPVLERLDRDTPIQVIGINVDSQFARFAKYHKRYHLTYPNYYVGFSIGNTLMLANLNYEIQAEEVRTFTQTPRYILLNPEGVLIKKSLPKPGSQAFYEVIRRYTQME